MAATRSLDEALAALDAYRTKLWLLLGESDANVHGAAACAILRTTEKNVKQNGILFG